MLSSLFQANRATANGGAHLPGCGAASLPHLSDSVNDRIVIHRTALPRAPPECGSQAYCIGERFQAVFQMEARGEKN